MIARRSRIAPRMAGDRPARPSVQTVLRMGGPRPTTRNVDETPFRFGLERVRELRAHAEDRAREEFAASLTRREQDLATLAAAVEQVRQARESRRDGSGAPLSGQDLIAHQLWLERVEADRRRAELELARRDAEIESRRQALDAAQQRREVIERLRERHRAEHEAADARRTGAALDEMALSIHRRRAGQ
jgi:flagellar FliJ protein